MIHAGQLRDRVLVYREAKQKLSTGERRSVNNLVGSFWCLRSDKQVSEVSEGKPIAVAQVDFTFRNSLDLVSDYQNLIIEDHDGLFEIIGTPVFLERKAFITLKAIKRE